MPTQTVAAIHFWLNALDNSLNVAQATITSNATNDNHSLEKRAICKLDVDASACRDIFQFATNAADLTDVSAEDMYFFVNANGFRDLSSTNMNFTANSENGTQYKGLYQNIGNAFVESTENKANHYLYNSAGDAYTPDNRGLIKDLFRDLAHQMFNTQYGVDLFANETDLCNNVFNNTSALFDNAGAIWTILDNANEKSIGWSYADSKLNIGRVLFEAIVDGDKDRLQDLSTNELASTASLNPAANQPGAGSNSQQNDMEMRKYKMPLKAGDTIRFHLRYKYDSNQKSIVNDTSAGNYEDRLYEVQLILV
jgi:hypothetical protein